jgi:NADH-quinone oxidoreductase subunit L
LSASIALTQTDLKRVLAYSTISQLGFMFMALGAGVGNVMQAAVVAAMFHLFTHAFFKALLFLASGSVMHATGGVIDMRRFRGLRHRMPITCWTFAIGGLALAGIPPLAGFWSKDEILTALMHAVHASNSSGGAGRSTAYLAIYGVAVFTAFLTAFYTGRAFFLTFFGPEKIPSPTDPEAAPESVTSHAPGYAPLVVGPMTAERVAYTTAVASGESMPAAGAPAARAGNVDPHRAPELPPPTAGATDEPIIPHDGHGHDQGHHADEHLGHESPPIMWVPLTILAACAVLVGLIFGPSHLFESHVLDHTPELGALGKSAHGLDFLTMGIGTLVGVAGLALSWAFYAAPSPLPGRLAQRLGPLYRASYRKFFFDEAYDLLVVAPVRLFASFSAWFDKHVIDNLVRLAAWLPQFVGRDVLGPLQNGLIQFYAVVTAAGLAALLLILLFAH